MADRLSKDSVAFALPALDLTHHKLLMKEVMSSCLTKCNWEDV